mgnify:CR=1 FL=1
MMPPHTSSLDFSFSILTTSTISSLLFDVHGGNDGEHYYQEQEQEQEQQLCFKSPTVETIPNHTVQLLLALLYCTTSFLSLLGNGIVIIVQIYGRETRNMRRYLLNLAIADLITGVLSVPFTYVRENCN